jgi:hypothetical protein
MSELKRRRNVNIRRLSKELALKICVKISHELSKVT